MMSNLGGPYSQFERDYAKRFAELSIKLQRIEDQLLTIMISPSSVANPKALKTAVFWRNMRRDITNEYKKMASIFNEWATYNIPLRYRDSLRLLHNRISVTRGVVSTAQKTITGMLSSTATSQITTALLADANSTYAQAILSGKNNMLRITRATQQSILSERIVDAVVSAGFELGDLRKSSDALASIFDSRLRNAIADKQFIQAGSRKYTPSYYAELVTRTKFHEAHSFAALQQAANYDTDLMQVSSHNTKTAICIPFEAKIFSISGKDKRFPQLTESPPYHPNCLHLLFPTFIEAMEIQGTLDSFSAFSNDKITRPPVPAGFIPVDKRGIKGVA